MLGKLNRYRISVKLSCCPLAIDEPLLWVLISYVFYWCGAVWVKGDGIAIYFIEEIMVPLKNLKTRRASWLMRI